MKLRDIKSQQQYNSFMPGLQVQREPASWKPWRHQGRQQKPLQLFQLSVPESWSCSHHPSCPHQQPWQRDRPDLIWSQKRKKKQSNSQSIVPSWPVFGFLEKSPFQETFTWHDLVLRACSLGQVLFLRVFFCEGYTSLVNSNLPKP